MKPSQETLEWIEKFYSDFEAGYRGIGQTYTRPKDYIERALRVINESAKRSKLMNQFEGKRGFYHEDN